MGRPRWATSCETRRLFDAKSVTQGWIWPSLGLSRAAVAASAAVLLLMHRPVVADAETVIRIRWNFLYDAVCVKLSSERTYEGSQPFFYFHFFSFLFLFRFSFLFLFIVLFLFLFLFKKCSPLFIFFFFFFCLFSFLFISFSVSFFFSFFVFCSFSFSF